MCELELQKKKKEQSLLLEKEKLTNEIVIAGLWQTPTQFEAGLSQLKNETVKWKAMKAQLKIS